MRIQTKAPAPEGIDFDSAMANSPPQDEELIDFNSAMKAKRPGRPKKTKPPQAASPPSNKTYLYNRENIDVSLLGINERDIKNLSDDNIKDRLTRQEIAFLEIYFNSPCLKGQDRMTIDRAMVSAGYGDFSERMRYLIARKTFQKYARGAPDAAKIFQALGFGQVSVAQGIIAKADGAKSETVSLNALALAAKCLKMTEEGQERGRGINIIINTGPGPGCHSWWRATRSGRAPQAASDHPMSEEITMAYRTAKSIHTTHEVEIFSWKRVTQGRWKLVFDESWTVETADNKVGEKHWYQQIPTYCGGFIGLYALNPIVLQFWSPKQRKTAKKIFEEFKATRGVLLDEAMDTWEVVLYFPIELLHIVAERVGARKKRRLSEDHRAKLIEAGKVGRKALQKWQTERSKGDQTDPNLNDRPEAMV